jgi:hypothetical protein
VTLATNSPEVWLIDLTGSGHATIGGGNFVPPKNNGVVSWVEPEHPGLYNNLYFVDNLHWRLESEQPVAANPNANGIYGILGNGTGLYGGSDNNGDNVYISVSESVDPCTLICPTNITECNTLGECGAVVTYPAPTITGDCGSSAVVCVPPSGSFFPVGTTTVTCTAPVGTNCSFDITVALCTTNCPLTQGFWKNHAKTWPVSTLQLGTVAYTQGILLKILSGSPGPGDRADASLILADQLIAAKLNLANGSDPCPIVSIIAAADALIDSHTIPIVPRITPSSPVGAQMVALASALNNYNEGLLTPNCAAVAP